MRRLLAPLAVFSLLGVAACTDAVPVAPVAPLTSPKPLAAKTDGGPVGPWAQTVEGSTGPGSFYGIYVQNNFNGNVLKARIYEIAWTDNAFTASFAIPGQAVQKLKGTVDAAAKKIVFDMTEADGDTESIWGELAE